MQAVSRAHAAGESHGIDLAPMLDFVVNLLIFFIITAVFVKQAGVDVSRPNRVDSSTDAAAKAIVVDRRGEISIDLKRIDVRAVRAHIELFRATGAGGVIIVADEGAPTGALVAVADQLRLGGISDITFTTAASTPVDH